MSLRVMEARSETIVIGEDQCTLYSHESLSEQGLCVVRLIVNHSELSVSAATRGEALLLLGEWMKEAGLKLVRLAFEQEGAVRL